MIRSETEAVDRKQRIRDRYKGVDTSELEVIPAKTVEGLGESTSIRRVAAYVRVSTDQRKIIMIGHNTGKGIITRQSYPEKSIMQQIICGHPEVMQRKIVLCQF